MATIYLVDDEPINLLTLQAILKHDGHSIVQFEDPQNALQAVQTTPPDLVITDWLMPEMDGIALTRGIRQALKNPPPIVMGTVVAIPQARDYLIRVAQMDGYLSKPFQPQEVRTIVSQCLATRLEARSGDHAVPPPPTMGQIHPASTPTKTQLFCIAASTGGQQALETLFAHLRGHLTHQAIVVVLHVQHWVMNAVMQLLREKTRIPIHLAENGLAITAGNIFFAPAGSHLEVTAQQTFALSDAPPVHHLKPAADPFFASVAKVYGANATGIVITGLGQDGGVGAMHLHYAGAPIWIQDPKTCVAPYMPENIQKTGVPHQVLTLEAMAQKIST